MGEDGERRERGKGEERDGGGRIKGRERRMERGREG